MEHISNHCPDVDEDLSFESWYSNYPKKSERKMAETRWNKLTDDEKRRAIIDVPHRLENHAQWHNKNMIPNPARYIFQSMWNDDIVTARTIEDDQKESFDGTPLSRLWMMLRQIYGEQRWTRQYGINPPKIWAKKLEDLTLPEIAKIVNQLESNPEGFIPGQLPDLPHIMRIRRTGKPFSTFIKTPKSDIDPNIVTDNITQIKELLS